MNDLALAIKERLPAREVFEAYGFNIGRGGFVSCPFHEGDRTGSLKIYDGTKGWHCFGCGAGDSVIDFAMKLFSLDFKSACAKLNDDFGLGLNLGHKPTKKEMSAVLETRRKAEQKRQQDEIYYNARAQAHRYLWDVIKERAPMAIGDEINPEYAEALKKQAVLEWWLDENISIGR